MSVCWQVEVWLEKKKKRKKEKKKEKNSILENVCFTKNQLISLFLCCE